MAKIKYTAIVADIRGSVLGTKFSRNHSGPYIQANTGRVNPDTPDQQVARQFFAEVSQSWRDLTENERQTWNVSAPTHSWNHLSKTGRHLTGFTYFVRLNRNLLEIGSPVITTPPTVGLSIKFTAFTLSADTTGGTFDITFAPAIPGTTKIIILAAAFVSPGRSNFKGPFKKIKVLDSGDISPIDLAAAYINTFGALPPVGGKAFIRMRPVNTVSGRPGNILSAFDLAF